MIGGNELRLTTPSPATPTIRTPTEAPSSATWDHGAISHPVKGFDAVYVLPASLNLHSEPMSKRMGAPVRTVNDDDPG
jgi:hypothetical protein